MEEDTHIFTIVHERTLVNERGTPFALHIVAGVADAVSATLARSSWQTTGIESVFPHLLHNIRSQVEGTGAREIAVRRVTLGVQQPRPDIMAELPVAILPNTIHVEMWLQFEHSRPFYLAVVVFAEVVE